MLSIIAAIDENNGIGYDNQLLCHLPKDLLYFKAVTMGKPVVMGRKTYESIGKPLKNRLNVVISSKYINDEGITSLSSLQCALDALSYDAEYFIIGGASLYEQTIGVADRLYLTRIHQTFEADRFFPSFDINNWEIKQDLYHPKDSLNKYDMNFLVYDRKK